MEFFKIIDVSISESDIQKIYYDTISDYCPSVFIIEEAEDKITAGTIWGEFLIEIVKITGGIRFSLINCPNALAMTITTGFPPEREKAILHLTINRTQKPIEFIDEINEFIEDWNMGMINFFTK